MECLLRQLAMPDILCLHPSFILLRYLMKRRFPSVDSTRTAALVKDTKWLGLSDWENPNQIYHMSAQDRYFS